MDYTHIRAECERIVKENPAGTILLSQPGRSYRGRTTRRLGKGGPTGTILSTWKDAMTVEYSAQDILDYLDTDYIHRMNDHRRVPRKNPNEKRTKTTSSD